MTGGIMRKNLLRTMLLWNLLFSVAAIWWMLAATGTGVLPWQNGKEGENQNPSENRAGMQDGTAADSISQSALYGGELPEEPLAFAADRGSPGFAFSLPTGVAAEDLFLENRCERQEFLIGFPVDCGDFFKQSVLTGNRDKVGAVYLSGQEGFTRLRLTLDDVYDYQCTVEKGMAVLTFERPDRFYDSIVLVDVEDASGRSADGKTDIAMDVAERVQSRLETEGIRVYCSLNTEMSVEERAAFAHRLGADLLIGIRQSESEETDKAEPLRILYNDTYYIPFFGNTQLVSLLDTYLSEETQQSVKAGISATETKDLILEHAQIPAAVIELGAGDKAPFMDEAYREALAAGIAGAVLEACGQIDSAQETYYER